jgi:hypothetical protein
MPHSKPPNIPRLRSPLQSGLFVTTWCSRQDLSLQHLFPLHFSDPEHRPGPGTVPYKPLPLTSRANVRWSRLLINGVPTGASETCSALCSAPVSHGHCDNTAYESFRVTQKPSRACDPSYAPGKVSSLVVAFEDPDGTTLALKSLLQRAGFHLRCRAEVRR